MDKNKEINKLIQIKLLSLNEIFKMDKSLLRDILYKKTTGEISNLQSIILKNKKT